MEPKRENQICFFLRVPPLQCKVSNDERGQNLQLANSVVSVGWQPTAARTLTVGNPKPTGEDLAHPTLHPGDHRSHCREQDQSTACGPHTRRQEAFATPPCGPAEGSRLNQNLGNRQRPSAGAMPQNPWPVRPKPSPSQKAKQCLDERRPERRHK